MKIMTLTKKGKSICKRTIPNLIYTQATITGRGTVTIKVCKVATVKDVIILTRLNRSPVSRSN